MTVGYTYTLVYCIFYRKVGIRFQNYNKKIIKTKALKMLIGEAFTHIICIIPISLFVIVIIVNQPILEKKNIYLYNIGRLLYNAT